jgi:hypothetical protein
MISSSYVALLRLLPSLLCMSFLSIIVLRYSVVVHYIVHLSTGVGTGAITPKDIFALFVA